MSDSLIFNEVRHIYVLSPIWGLLSIEFDFLELVLIFYIYPGFWPSDLLSSGNILYSICYLHFNFYDVYCNIKKLPFAKF